MNFPNNFRKVGFIFLLGLLLTNSKQTFLSAQYQDLGLPIIEHITPPAQYGMHPYQSVIIDHYGFLFLSGDNGILRFDGTRWEPLSIPGKTCITINESSQVFVAGDNTFGLIKYRTDGSLEFYDLVIENNQPDYSLGQVTMIVSLNDQVYILSNTGLHLWENQEIQYNIISELPKNIFKKGDRIYFLLPKSGLFQYFKDEVSQVADNQNLGIESLSQCFLNDNNLYIFTEGKGLQQWHEDELLPAINGSLNLFSEYEVTDFVLLSEEANVMATRSGELILNQNFTGSNLINKESGLYDNQINHLLYDQSGNLWVVHNDGLTRIEWPSPLTLFHSKNGLEGNVNDFIRHGNFIYAATSEGVYSIEQIPDKLHGITKNLFQPVPGINDACDQFIQVENDLFIVTEDGLFQIINNSALLALPGKFNTLCQLPYDPDVILAGTNTGLIRINMEGGSLITQQVAEGFELPVTNISTGYDRIWWSAPQSEIFYLSKINLTGSDPQSAEYNPFRKFPEHLSLYKIININGDVVFHTSGGLYSYSSETDQILPFLKQSYRALSSRDIKISNIWKDSNENLWVGAYYQNTNEQTIFRLNHSDSAEFELNPVFERLFKDQQINSIYTENENTVWICCNDQLVRFDMSSPLENTTHFTVFINEVIINKDSSIYYPFPGSDMSDQTDERFIQLPFTRNDITFKFSSNHLSGEGGLQYQCKLKGWEDNWTGWEPISFKTYHSLPRGTYFFEVRSKDIHGSVSNLAPFTFKVMRPLLWSWWTILIYIVILLAGVYFIQKWRAFLRLKERYHLEDIVEERTESLLKEKEKTDNLLANLLPKTTADELMASGKAKSSKFKMVTVLFSDIEGFTKIAEQMNPDLLIDELDQFYFQFDSVVEKYNIEKIKTIGDAYMAAGGIPVKNRTNPVEVVLAALEMQHFMKELKKTKTDIWDLRIGIHTGSVIAGVVGQKKFSYDIWGDTVNTASRMESSGEIGKVNISATTYELIKDFFDCEYRGKMPVKYKGDIEMYFVKSLKPSLRGETKETPNKDFHVNLQMLRLLDLEEYVTQKLNDESPESLYFHTAAHTYHVYTQVEILGRSEKVPIYDLLLLRSAALLHDIGYIDNIDKHEERSVEMAREILPIYRYPDEQIEQICDLILATKLSNEPQNLLQKIIYDANLDHIGRIDFLIQSDKLYQEMRALNKVKSKKDWNEQQIRFLNEHDFYTDAAQKLREVKKEQQIQNIKEFS